eukprot:CAMPEP_0203912086 /NCGR_PEP_ID=MMETSP0359-20131031/53179_1 /ASSEMBLY_ACC=CAM_ASM_000338 /TAXON_ID=268821 /ORGANISM="Scrippsiella Hangoei, Strain SHTV-5" /LENGTH=451 /DNA_ID=CAMNT_0050837945 /DNA_START=106 /DNA_END=1461 /DNA_ORIENTATION=-
MSLADLQRLVKRAVPRHEDNRTPDRLDIVRKEFGHLKLREIVDAVDALEFSADAFVEVGRQLPGAEDPATFFENPGAVHGALRAVAGIRFLCPALVEAVAPKVAASGQEEAPEGEASEEQTKAAADAKARGAESFKQKDFAAAEAAYSEAISSLPRGHGDLHTVYSNRCAARLQGGIGGGAVAALADARRCVELAPQWPKGHFREGSCLRQMEHLPEATKAFRAGKTLEPDNKDWDKEIEKTEVLRCVKLPALGRQLLFSMLPELLWAWVRGGDPEGVLSVQINGEFTDFGKAKWRLVKETREKPATASLRYAFQSRKDYFANLAANLQNPPKEGVAVVDLAGKPLKIAEINAFLQDSGTDAVLHLDVRHGGGADKMAAVLCRVPCDECVRMFLGTRKEPEAPKNSIEPVLHLQRTSGFPKALPRYIGFQAMPGDLNFPVIDIVRDAPSMA